MMTATVGIEATAKEAAYEKYAKRIFGTRPRSLDSITHFYAGWNAAESRTRELEEENTILKKALNLAVNMVMENEPGDSRAVSNEAVALAAVACGLPMTPETTRVIEAALASNAQR
jgi:hypothetical protein